MGKTMDIRIALAFALVASSTAGCFQQLDSGATGGPEDLKIIPPSAGPSDASTLPTPFTDADLQAALSTSQPCTPGSPLCFELCGSPSCALQSNNIPTNLGSEAAILPDGGASTNPCDDINARALQIRQQSCSPCHGAPPGQSGFSWVLSDSDIVTKVAPGLTTPVVIAGDPDDSPLMQRVITRISTPTALTGMPPPSGQLQTYVAPALAATIVYPTAEDVSVLYTWITACVPGADAGSFDNAYYGGNYAPASLDGGNK